MSKITRKINLVGVGAGLLAFCILIGVIYQLARPRPNTAAFCKLYAQFNSTLSASSSSSELATAYGKLEQLAPADIHESVRSVHKMYSSEATNSTSSLDRLGSLSDEADIEGWVSKHCGK